MKETIISISWLIIYPIITLTFAWVPMLGWNHGLHSIYPNVFPVITYWQAFWVCIALGGIFSRPQFHKKD